MEKKLLKTVLFGYSKTSVCEYIAQVNEEFSQRLMEITDAHKKDKDELKAKIAVLESELAQYRQTFSDIGTALLDAQQHAVAMKQQTEEDNRRLRAENAEKAAAQTRRIAVYKAAIDDLRRRLSDFVSETDKELQTFYENATDIAAEYEEKEKTAV